MFYKAAIVTLLSVGTSATALAANTGAPTPENMLPHFDSLIALGVVLMAMAIASLLNHRSPKQRALGTALASIACFGVVAWFVVVLQTGVLENPKPHQAPMDAMKPSLLWGQAFIALLAGIWLIFLAFVKSQSNDVLELGSQNEAHRYGRTSRVLHWTTAILFIFMIPTGIFSSMIPADAWYRTEYNVIHKTIGIIIFILVVARLIWNKLSPRPSLDDSLKPIERKMAHVAHMVLYGLLIAIPVTGYVMTSQHGYSTYFFIIELPPILAESQAYIYWGAMHKYLLQYVVYLVLGAHILGALKHQFIDKHKNAFKRMVD